jgi:hypothetical protein
MKIWGTNKKQRMYLFVIIATLWIGSFIWCYVTKPAYESTFTLLGSTVLIMIFYGYLIIDNIRAGKIKFTISMCQPNIEKIIAKYHFEFNDILCRKHIGNEIKDYLTAESSKTYNYKVIDVSTAIEVDRQTVRYEIWADNQHRNTITILNSGKVNSIALI